MLTVAVASKLRTTNDPVGFALRGHDNWMATQPPISHRECFAQAVGSGTLQEGGVAGTRVESCRHSFWNVSAGAFRWSERHVDAPNKMPRVHVFQACASTGSGCVPTHMSIQVSARGADKGRTNPPTQSSGWSPHKPKVHNYMSALLTACLLRGYGCASTHASTQNDRLSEAIVLSTDTPTPAQWTCRRLCTRRRRKVLRGAQIRRRRLPGGHRKQPSGGPAFCST